jgi:HEAT repeat protein
VRAPATEETDGYAPEPMDGTAGTLAALVTKITDAGAADVDRLAAAYAVGRAQTAQAVAALVELLSHPAESARRAAGYGLTVGGPLAADAAIKLLLEPPTIPARDPPVADNVDEQAACIPPLAHVISQLATHAVSLPAVDGKSSESAIAALI